MVAQREACGWTASEVVPSWVPRAEEGLKTMFWVVSLDFSPAADSLQALADSSPDREAFIQAHKDGFPGEAEPLQDTAQSLNLAPREPSGAEFVPVGHVGLNKGPTADLEGHVEGLLPSEGVYWISSLFISPCIQRRGLGRAVMSRVESLVAQPASDDVPDKDIPEAALSGTTIALDVPPREWQVGDWARDNWWGPLNLPMPKISNLEWYQQQGYSVFTELPDFRPATLPDGSVVSVPLLLLKKSWSDQRDYISIYHIQCSEI
ncbi:hypothetical protein EKO27_g2486 [Xylaria grammica]|uniref:Uncharacterized protein n=1 Tax=Xylaria grammica TaxID=363999 RepID=A0A439DDY3_9PEZI|nr:hypothetical protein EKO27_g2486 [Xylaria grammica]